jgi:hypothetical protein
VTLEGEVKKEEGDGQGSQWGGGPTETTKEEETENIEKEAREAGERYPVQLSRSR